MIQHTYLESNGLKIGEEESKGVDDIYLCNI